ncbi:MAG: hypothetical protein K5919_10230, partial [Clostridiales bacterium]|nr:hypothetical protein [Clostridiales bacterium]
MKKRITAFILTVALLFMNVNFSAFSEGTETADAASGNEGSISITEGQNDSLDAEQEEAPAADQGAISEGNQDEIAVLYGEESPAGDPGETAADQTENALTINSADADDTDPNDVQEGSADYQVQNDPSGDTLNEAAIEPQNIAADGVQDDVTDQNDETSDLREEGSGDPADETVPDAQDVISVDSQGKDTEDNQDADNDNAQDADNNDDQDADNNDDQDADGSDKQDVASGDVQDPIPVDAQEKASDDPQDEATNLTENEAEKENREEEDPAGQQDELSAAGQTDASAEGQDEADADDQISDASEHTEKFVSGYIYVKNSTIAYSSVNMQNAVGQFDALSVAYAETAQDGGDFSSSILRIRFDTETAKRSGSGLITAYISGRDASIIGNEEAQRLTAQWKGSGTVREYNGKPLPVASYTDKTIHDQDEMPAVQQAETPESAKSEAEDTAQAGPAAGEADETPAGSDTETKESADAEKLEEQPVGIQQEKNTEDQPEGKQEAKANDESDALPEGNQSTSENTQIIGKSRLLSTRGLTLAASGNKLATPTISSHSDRQQISWGDIEDGLTIRWNSVTNGKYYYYAIKMLDGTPGSGDNEAGTMLANNNSTTSRRVTIDREYLIAGRWIKIYVCALANGDYAASDAATIYIYIKPTTQLSKPVITTHSNQQHISWNDVTNGMTVRWNAVSNCSTYYYAIKLLDGEPSSGTSENGTMIALNESTSSKYVTVGSDQLEAKKWVKIYIQANGTGDYTANSTTIYVYIEGKSQLSAPVITSHTNQQTVQYSNLDDGLTFKWNAVTNATGYIYAVKLLDGEPNPSDNETGTMLAQANGTTARTVTITQSKLAQNKWVKLYVQAYGSGYNANSTTIYVYVQGKSQLAAPVVTSHTDRQTVQYGNLGSGLTFSWNAVANATGYIYAVKLLDGEPNPSDNETGTMLAHVNGTTARTVTITQGKLAQ